MEKIFNKDPLGIHPCQVPFEALGLQRCVNVHTASPRGAYSPAGRPLRWGLTPGAHKKEALVAITALAPGPRVAVLPSSLSPRHPGTQVLHPNTQCSTQCPGQPSVLSDPLLPVTFMGKGSYVDLGSARVWPQANISCSWARQWGPRGWSQSPTPGALCLANRRPLGSSFETSASQPGNTLEPPGALRIFACVWPLEICMQVV